MSYQSNKVLHLLRKAQPKEGEMIYIDFENGCLWEFNNNQAKPVKIPYYQSKMISIFEKLLSDGYIIKEDRDWEYLILTHKGYHLRQTRIEEFYIFMLKSVVVPIVVAAITAIAVYYIESHLSEKYESSVQNYEQTSE